MLKQSYLWDHDSPDFGCFVKSRVRNFISSSRLPFPPTNNSFLKCTLIHEFRREQVVLTSHSMLCNYQHWQWVKFVRNRTIGGRFGDYLPLPSYGGTRASICWSERRRICTERESQRSIALDCSQLRMQAFVLLWSRVYQGIAKDQLPLQILSLRFEIFDQNWYELHDILQVWKLIQQSVHMSI